MNLSLADSVTPDIFMPDWDKKIVFNKLSHETALRLENGTLQLTSLQKYLEHQGAFLSDELRDKMSEIYSSEMLVYKGDELFWSIVKKASPRSDMACESAVIVIMAKYFESCDIFERPPEADK